MRDLECRLLCDVGRYSGLVRLLREVGVIIDISYFLDLQSYTGLGRVICDATLTTSISGAAFFSLR